MKREKWFTLIFLMISFVFISCETSDDDNDNDIDNDDISVTEIQATVTTGTWVVSLFEEEGVDETSDFAGFRFTFNEGGVLRADSGDNSISGAWSISSDDDDSQEDIDFNIFFSSPANFEELTEDWDIVSYSDTRIELSDESDDTTTVDRLIFQRQ